MQTQQPSYFVPGPNGQPQPIVPQQQPATVYVHGGPAPQQNLQVQQPYVPPPPLQQPAQPPVSPVASPQQLNPPSPAAAQAQMSQSQPPRSSQVAPAPAGGTAGAEEPPAYELDPKIAAMAEQTKNEQFFDESQQNALFGAPPDYNQIMAQAQAQQPQQQQLQAPGAPVAQAAGPTPQNLPPAFIPPASDELQLKAIQLLPSGQELHPTFLQDYKVEMKGYDGPVVHDENVNANLNVLAGFFARYNVPPTFQVAVRGHHLETRYRTYTDANGHVRTESYTEDVTDFHYSVDASRFLWPVGMMQVLPEPKTGRQRTLHEVLNEYAVSENKLKNITMYKTIGWNFARLHRLVNDAVRSAGWWRLLDINFPMQNNMVTARSDSTIANLYSNSCIKCLCIFPFFIPFGAIWFTSLCCYAKNFDDSLRSHFGCWLTEEQFVMVNRFLFVPFSSGNCPVMKGNNAAMGGEGCCHACCPSFCNCPRDV